MRFGAHRSRWSLCLLLLLLWATIVHALLEDSIFENLPEFIGENLPEFIKNIMDRAEPPPSPAGNIKSPAVPRRAVPLPEVPQSENNQSAASPPANPQPAAPGALNSASTSPTVANSDKKTSALTNPAQPLGQCPICPACFSCTTSSCLNLGECKTGQCVCAEGLGGSDCSLPTCNSTNVPAFKRSPRLDLADCKCDDGFTGLNCNICLRNDVCKTNTNSMSEDLTRSDARICNRSPRVYRKGHMMCDTKHPMISGRVQVTVERNLKDKTAFTSLWLDSVIQFSCKISNCEASLHDNTDIWKCDDIQCQLNPHTKLSEKGNLIGNLLRMHFKELIGGVELSCPLNSISDTIPATTLPSQLANNQQAMVDCSFVLKGLLDILPDGISLTNCIFGECAYATDAPLNQNIVSKIGFSAGEISGISILSVLLGGILLALFLGKRQQYSMRRLPLPQPQRGVKLQFLNVSYHVNIASGNTWKRFKTKDNMNDLNKSNLSSHNPILLSDSSSFERTSLQYNDQRSPTILNSVSGAAHSGRLLAIMGPSGAGKSSLLDILAQKSKQGTVTGTFLVDDQSVIFPSKSLRNIIGYVDQEDILLPYLTVRESLLFAANMRLPESTPKDTKNAIVESVMKQLGILDVADSRIGGSGHRGISGGERRRVSIGIELVTSPAVLFLDEPTSGLDSYNAHRLMQTLSQLAKDQSKTIICSIHQPRSDVFSMFDDLCILSKGQVVYFGERARVTQAFAQRGFRCPENYNMADYLIDLAIMHQNDQRSTTGFTVVDNSSLDTSSNNAINTSNIPTASETLPHDRDINTKIKHEADLEHDSNSESTTAATSTVPPDQLLSNDYTRVDTKEHLALPPVHIPLKNQDTDSNKTFEYNTSFLTQVNLLSGRAFKCLVRNPRLLLGHNAIALSLGILVGLLYYRIDDTIAGFQNRLGAISFLEALVGFSSLSALGTFVEERQVFLRERSSKCYHPMAFFFVKSLLDLIPLRVLPTIIMCTIPYFMIGLQNTISHYLCYIVILILFSIVTALFCLAIAAYTKDISIGNLTANIVMLFSLLLGSILLNPALIPLPLRWIQYLSFFRFSTEALAVNEVKGLTLRQKLGDNDIAIPGKFILEQFSYNPDSFTRNLLVLAGLDVLFILIVGLIVRYRLKEIR